MNTTESTFERVDGEVLLLEETSKKTFQENDFLYTSLYTTCFAEPPYQEDFTHEDVMKLAMGKWFETGSIVLSIRSKEAKAVYSYLVAYPIELETDVFTTVKDKIFYAEKYLYVAEILTHPLWRLNGFANRLLVLLIKKYGDMPMIVRTNVNNVPSQTLFSHNGFIPLDGVREIVTQARLENAPSEDERLFMVRKPLIEGMGWMDTLRR